MLSCPTCRFLVKSGGHRGAEALRHCLKGRFYYVPLKRFKPHKACPVYEKKKQKSP